jgi:hypothetical protein
MASALVVSSVVDAALVAALAVAVPLWAATVTAEAALRMYMSFLDQIISNMM